MGVSFSEAKMNDYVLGGRGMREDLVHSDVASVATDGAVTPSLHFIDCKCTAIESADEFGRVTLKLHDFKIRKVVNGTYRIALVPVPLPLPPDDRTSDSVAQDVFLNQTLPKD
jgi:hypothetical protein